MQMEFPGDLADAIGLIGLGDQVNEKEACVEGENPLKFMSFKDTHNRLFSPENRATLF